MVASLPPSLPGSGSTSCKHCQISTLIFPLPSSSPTACCQSHTSPHSPLFITCCLTLPAANRALSPEPTVAHVLPPRASAITPPTANHTLSPSTIAGGYFSSAAKHLGQTMPQGIGWDEGLGMEGQEAIDSEQSLAENQRRRKACCGSAAVVDWEVGTAKGWHLSILDPSLLHFPSLFSQILLNNPSNSFCLTIMRCSGLEAEQCLNELSWQPEQMA